jgi:C1A family cysteine protease
MSRIYNLKKQNKDNRDYIYKLSNNIVSKNHHFITDMPKLNCPILDQGNIGSCLANAIYALIYILSNGKYKLSRLQLYMCFRAIDKNSLSEDTGGTIRSGMSAIKNYGISSEAYWPYITTNFSKLAPSKSFVDKYVLKNFVYQFIPRNLNSIKNCLLSGKPIVVGIEVYSSFETPNVDKYGVVPMPNLLTENLLGGHAILLVGFDDKSKVFKFQNSWSTSWGDNGYGYLPYDYVLNNNLTYDLCTVSFN